MLYPPHSASSRLAKNARPKISRIHLIPKRQNTNKNIGKITVEERDKKTVSAIQMVFQNPFDTLNPSHSVGNQIIRTLEKVGVGSTVEERKQRMYELLDLVKLPREFEKRMPRQLSGGQKQRIGIARAFAGSPKIVVADEPVSALDVSIRAQIMNLLVDLQNEHDLAYILIAHNLATVRYMCHRTAVMYLGVVQEYGDTEEIFANPTHLYTNALISAALPSHPDIERDEIVLPGEVVSPVNPPVGDVFQTRTPLPVRKNHKYTKERPPLVEVCLLYTSPSPRDRTRSRMPSSA